MAEQQSDAASAISSVAAVASTVMFLSNWPLMRQMALEKDSRAYSWMPAYGLALTTFLWLGYGISLLPTPQVIFNNVFGGTQALLYLATFAYYSHKDLRRRWTIIGATAGYALTVLVFFWAMFGQPGYLDPAHPTYEARKNTVATILIIVNTSLWASPLQALYGAWRVLSLKRVSLPMSVLQWISSILWTVAGLLLRDTAVITTSVVGFVLTSLQLVCIALIWTARNRRIAQGVPLPVDPHDVPAAAAQAGGAAGSSVGGPGVSSKTVDSDTVALKLAGPGAAAVDASGDALHLQMIDVSDVTAITAVTAAADGDGVPVKQAAVQGKASAAPNIVAARPQAPSLRLGLSRADGWLGSSGTLQDSPSFESISTLATDVQTLGADVQAAPAEAQASEDVGVPDDGVVVWR